MGETAVAATQVALPTPPSRTVPAAKTAKSRRKIPWGYLGAAGGLAVMVLVLVVVVLGFAIGVTKKTPTAAPTAAVTEITDLHGVRMALIPAGDFEMGS